MSAYLIAHETLTEGMRIDEELPLQTNTSHESFKELISTAPKTETANNHTENSKHTTSEEVKNIHDELRANVQERKVCTTSESPLHSKLKQATCTKNLKSDDTNASCVKEKFDTIDKTAADIIMPINATEILHESWEKQRQSILALELRLADAEVEVNIKKHRWELLRSQRERREAWCKYDLMHVQQTSKMLQSVILAIRDRQTSLRAEGVQAFIFPNNDIYEGNWKNCTLHGKGCLRRELAKDIYEGQWFQGQRCGQGMYHSSHYAFYYSGSWLDDKMHGKGELIEPEGMYVGDLVHNEPHGFGEYTYHDGHAYRGEWSGGFYNGNGSYSMPCGTRYEGHWRNGKEDGKGRMTFANGDVYNGEWRKGLPHGYGVYSSFAMRIDGNWSYGSVHGKATCTYSNGCVYVGNWHRGKYNGSGQFIYESCSTNLFAFLSEHKQHEELEEEQPQEEQQQQPESRLHHHHHHQQQQQQEKQLLQSSHEQREKYQDMRRISYNGEFVNGQRHGYGEYVTEGLQYKGDWKHGAKHGSGKLIIGAEHTMYNGEWQNDLPSGDAIFSVGKHTVTMRSENGECLETTEVDAYKSVDISIQPQRHF